MRDRARELAQRMQTEDAGEVAAQLFDETVKPLVRTTAWKAIATG